MPNLEKIKIINIFIKNLIECFSAWFWKIKNNNDVDKINNLIDKLLVNNFSNLEQIFKNENQEKLLGEYNFILNKIKNTWKSRYIKFNILNI